MKMLSYPSDGGRGLSQESQLTYFEGVLGVMRDDVSGPARLYASFFAAFDNDWKTHEKGWSVPETHTGLYDLSRSPKMAIRAFSRMRRRW